MTNLAPLIRSCMQRCSEPVTTCEVADQIGARRERVQTEMMLMHNKGALHHAGWKESHGRKRPTYQLADGSGHPALPPHTGHRGHKVK